MKENKSTNKKISEDKIYNKKIIKTQASLDRDK